jgi:DNA repair protein RecO (recombination protein O)
MLREVEGIIINETSYGEMSKIINILTKEGLIGIVCKGAKSVKSPFRSFTMSLTYGKFIIYYKENSLSTLKGVDIIDNFSTIKRDIVLTSYMSFLCDLAKQVMKQNNDENIYYILIDALKKIDEGLNPMIITNIVELKYLDYLGVGINFNSCAKCGSTHDIVTINPDIGGYVCKNCYINEIIYDEKTLKMLRMYYLVELASISDLKISDKVVSNINYFISKYYDRYTGLYLKSKKFLEEIIE